MEATESRAGGTTTLRISGRVDGSVSKQLEQRVQDIISRDEHVIVDLGAHELRVERRACAASSSSPSTPRRSRRASRWSPCRTRSPEIFEISGLLKLFKVYGTVDDAVAALPR